VLGAIEVSTGRWVYRLGRRCAADFIALLDQVLRAFPRAPVIVMICDKAPADPFLFRARSPDEMLATAAPWTSPWPPPVTSRTSGMPL
jgi:hypothetical protein